MNLLGFLLATSIYLYGLMVMTLLGFLISHKNLPVRVDGHEPAGPPYESHQFTCKG
jgi:hypothetical protein